MVWAFTFFARSAPISTARIAVSDPSVALLYVLQDRLADLRSVLSLGHPERRRNVIRLLVGADHDQLRAADLRQLGGVSHRRPGRPRPVGAHQDPLEHAAPFFLKR